jgi:hypothetical protein
VRDDLNFDPEFPRTDTTDSDTALPGEEDENPVSGANREAERGDEWWAHAQRRRRHDDLKDAA